jgi:PAS domain S-box-containing protein
MPLWDWSAVSEPEHFVQFYETDSFLVDSLKGFISAGLNAGDACIIVARKSCREGLEQLLQAQGLDITAACASGQYTTLDSSETLSKFMIDGVLEPQRFNEVIGNLIQRVAQGNRRVRIFGDMVEVLCADGSHALAIRLEELWNQLQKTYPFSLFCGYSMESFGDSHLAESLSQLCSQHTHIIPAESYSTLESATDRLRAITLLQQQAISLQTETAGRKIAEEQLRIFELSHQRLFENLQDCILMLDFETRKITHANPMTAHLLGLAKEELKGKELWEIGLFENPQAVEEAFHELQKKEFVRLERLLMKPDGGQPRNLELVCQIYEANGHLVIQCNIRDITARKEAEAINAHLAAIVESSDDAIISKSLEGIILSWNKGAERIFGYTAEEVIGKPISILIPPDRLAEEPLILQRLKAGARIDHYETVRMTKDGRAVMISLTISPIRDLSGNIIAASKIARDITERKQAEATLCALKDELEGQVEDLRQLHELSVSLMTKLDIELVLEEVLRATLAIQGTDLGMLSLYDAQHNRLNLKVHSGFDDDFLETVASMPIGEGACGVCYEQGRRVIIEDVETDPTIAGYRDTARLAGIRACHSIPLFTRGRTIIGVLSVYFRQPHRPSEREIRLMDVYARMATDSIETARLHHQVQQELIEREQLLEREQLARARAEEASRLKDEFLATVSHELRTPLNAIIGWSHMLRSGRLDDAAATRALDTIERNAKTQAQLVEDILDVSRVITGKLRLNIGQVDLIEVINAAVDCVQLAANSKTIRLDLVLDPGARQIAGDASRLQQVVWNLLANAIKFTPSGGTITLWLNRADAEVQLRISDSGQGIHPDFLPFIFDRFRQGDGTTTRAHGGLGLGLAIVRHLVEMHGGTVAAHSLGVGYGATFTIKLPLNLTPEQVSDEKRFTGTRLVYKPANADPKPLPVLDGVRVLLVDDDQDTLHIVKLLLMEYKASVRTASSVAEALEVLPSYKPNVIVSDLSMPGEDGYSLISKLRAMEATDNKQIPVVALTAYARVEDRMRALSAGFNMFVPKPIEPHELLSAIATLAKSDTAF